MLRILSLAILTSTASTLFWPSPSGCGQCVPSCAPVCAPACGSSCGIGASYNNYGGSSSYSSALISSPSYSAGFLPSAYLAPQTGYQPMQAPYPQQVAEPLLDSAPPQTANYVPQTVSQPIVQPAPAPAPAYQAAPSEASTNNLLAQNIAEQVEQQQQSAENQEQSQFDPLMVDSSPVLIEVNDETHLPLTTMHSPNLPNRFIDKNAHNVEYNNNNNVHAEAMEENHNDNNADEVVEFHTDHQVPLDSDVEANHVREDATFSKNEGKLAKSFHIEELFTNATDSNKPKRLTPERLENSSEEFEGTLRKNGNEKDVKELSEAFEEENIGHLIVSHGQYKRRMLLHKRNVRHSKSAAMRVKPRSLGTKQYSKVSSNPSTPPTTAVQASVAPYQNVVAASKNQEVIEEKPVVINEEKKETTDEKPKPQKDSSDSALEKVVDITQLKLTDDPLCNSEDLRTLMIENIDENLNSSKRLIQLAAEAQFGGRFDVVCANSDFSYVTNTELYCQETKGDVSCYTYRQM